MTKGYRPNVGMMIINRDKKVWMGVRVKSEDQFYRMQMPQGGIDKGETPLEAVYREMYEETGLHKKDVHLLGVAKRWYKYDLPETTRRRRSIRGQRQKWFLFYLQNDNAEFNLKTYEYQEFESYQWRPLEEIDQLVIPFKQEIYRQVIQEFKPIIETLSV